MIATSLRASLTAGDYRLALALLAPDGEERRRLEARTEAEGPDVLWDDPRLVDRLLAYRGLDAPSAALFLYTVMRRLLQETGVADRAVADYCAALLLVFGRGDRALRISEHEDDRTAYLVDLMIAAGRAEGERLFRVQMHIGDFALWMAGIFPDYIAARRARKGGPGLDYYERAGRAAFLEASDHRLADRYGLGDVLRQAGERFAQLRVALNRMSDRMLFPHHAGPDRLLRQVADEFRLRELQWRVSVPCTLPARPATSTRRSEGDAVPTYEYQCQKCRTRFSVVQRMSAHTRGRAACPKCRSRETRQLLSAFYAKTIKKS